MTDRCEPEEAQRRADLILELQAGIMDDYNAACIGRDMTVLCEHTTKSGMCSGRTYADSPEIDGTVYFTARPSPATWSRCASAAVTTAILPGNKSKNEVLT